MGRSIGKFNIESTIYIKKIKKIMKSRLNILCLIVFLKDTQNGNNM